MSKCSYSLVRLAQCKMCLVNLLHNYLLYCRKFSWENIFVNCLKVQIFFLQIAKTQPKTGNTPQFCEGFFCEKPPICKIVANFLPGKIFAILYIVCMQVHSHTGNNFFSEQLKKCPGSIPLWVLLSRLEENAGV